MNHFLKLYFLNNAPFVQNTQANESVFTTQYTIKQVCSILDVTLPEEYSETGNVVLKNITCEVNSLASGGCFILFGTTNADRKQQIKRALNIKPNLMIGGRASEKLFTDAGIPYIIVPDAYDAMVKLSASVRNDLDMTVIGVTGSVGKTSTKEIIASVLQQHYRVSKNFGNRNNTKGIFISLQTIPKDTQIYVQEFGVAIGSKSMESKVAACIPNATVITNISDPHVDILGSRENILKEKVKLALAMKPGSPVFLNYDDALLKNLQLDNYPIISYAVENKEADYYSENLQVMDGYITFDIVHGQRRTPITLYSYGVHNVANALVAMAVGEWAGVPLEKIAAGIAEFKTEGIRQSMVAVGGYKLYLDCYNASPLSMKGAIKTLEHLPVEPGGKRVAVIGEMLGLGEHSVGLHIETGEQISQADLDLFICFGGKPVEHMVQKLQEANKTVLYTDNREVLNNYIRQHVTDKDVAIFKGSHGMMLFKSVDQVYGTSFFEKEGNYQITIDGSYRCKLFAENGAYDIAAIARYSGKEADLTIPGSFQGADLIYLSPSSFHNNIELQSVCIPAPVFNIGRSAFKGCTNLKKVTLPESLKVIEAEAFRGCSMLEEITIPEGVIDIGDGAFCDCTSLERVVLPSSLGHLGDYVFDGCPNVVIVHS